MSLGLPCYIVESSDGAALIDWRDWSKVATRTWRIQWIGKKTKKPYVTAGTHIKIAGQRKSKMLYLHRVIMDAPDGMDVDHINGNPLDNRRCNLRIATRSQNLCNSDRPSNRCGFRGVVQTGKTFLARLGRGDRIGVFPTAEEAARAYDTVAIQKFGEFARLNFPHERTLAARDSQQPDEMME